MKTRNVSVKKEKNEKRERPKRSKRRVQRRGGRRRLAGGGKGQSRVFYILHSGKKKEKTGVGKQSVDESSCLTAMNKEKGRKKKKILSTAEDQGRLFLSAISERKERAQGAQSVEP